MIDRVPISLRRVAFWMFVSGIFIATHWPNLKIDVPRIERPDLLVHFVVFGCWALLVHFTGYLGDVRSLSTTGRSWLVAAAYACIDEALQLPTFVRRHAAWDDLAANVGGVTIGLAAVAAWILITSHPHFRRR